MWTNKMLINLDVLILDELVIASAEEAGLVLTKLGTNKTVYCAYACVQYSSLNIFRQYKLIEF